MLRRSHRLAVLTIAIACTGDAGSVLAQPGQTRGAYTDERKLPDTPAGKRVREIIELINAGDALRARKYVEENFAPGILHAHPLDQHMAVFGQLHDRSRELEFYSVRKYEQPRSEDEMVVILRNKLTEGWDAIIISVGVEPPHRIESLMFAPARPPSDLPPAQPMSDDEIVKAAQAYVDRVAAADVFSGTVLLARDGKVLLEKAYGPATRSYPAPNRIDTKFNLGSMNKMFTAVAILQLVERGKLSLTDPLSKHLGTDWLEKETADKITIAQLLSHTSGLGSYFNEQFMNASRDLFRAVDDYKPLLEGATTAFEPGTRWGYSNTGFLLLGAVIEKAAGQDYFTHVRENVHKPAGMTNTDCYELDLAVENLAMGYSKEFTPTGPRWRSNIFRHVIRGGPAGGGYSTVGDLLKFDQALRGGKLLKPASLEMAWTAKPESPMYGYGFGLSGTPGNRVIGHSGGFAGISARLDMCLDSGYTLVVLANVDGGAELVAGRIAQMLPKKP